ncbi:septum formation initiator family protein [Clostridium sp. NSJ-49]|uniref:Septum formation initiator n=1 Tax=Clostridium disporicum TaxID=84024 RepID=A0A174EAG1_9CLOT|nr:MULTISPECIES: septum formation initiator family protein [Clostridium]MBC5624215.1 septum formation initiator family protein [Clostridium sp. NSJ-49]MCD2502543.1 septum formation initiator family protein [Clostridium sp. NSJ-145]CUO34633.1 septum formation initiator [Clostridium disporicum]
MRKKITLRSIVIIILFVVFGFNVVKQTMAIKRINNDIAKKSEQLNEKKEENRKLQAELERVQSNYDYLEKLARERLGLIKEGEQIILPSEPQE